MIEKLCSVCHQVKPLTAFYKGCGLGGRLSRCKVCHNKYVKEYRAKNIDESRRKTREAVKKYRDEHPEYVQQEIKYKLAREKELRKFYRENKR